MKKKSKDKDSDADKEDNPYIDRVTFAKMVAEDYALRKITFDEAKKKLAQGIYKL